MNQISFLYSGHPKPLNLKRTLILVAFFFVLLFTLLAHSQTLGRISGIVMDASGGAIAGATITVTDVARGIPRTVTTDTAGAYVAPNLIPGTYTVHATYMGFRPYDRQDIALGVGGDVHVDVTLQPGEQTQAITVTGEAPAITTTNAQLEGTITANALSDLPFSGHNYVQLIGLLPTFQLKPGSGAGRTQDNSNGLPGEFNVFVLDGVADQMSYFSTSAVNGGYSAGGPEQAVMLPTDAIQEFNVVENGKAEFGWRPGAQLNVAVKSGTNAIHGTAFALGRDTALMARNAFFSTVTPTAFENYGGSFGGRALKDKLFYLLGYEGQRYNVGNPKNSNVPTTAPGLGTSSSLPDAINDLLAHGVNPSQLSLNLAGCVLGPPVQCTANKGLFANNTLSTSFPINFPTFGGTDNGVGRADYHLNEHHSFAAYFFDGDGLAVAPVSNVTQPYWSSPLEVHTKVVRTWWTWVPNSAWVNDARFGWDWTRSSNSPSYDCAPNAGAPNYAALGFVSGGTACGFPAVTITGFTGNVLAGAGGLDENGAMSRWLDNVSYTHGNHIFKFGGEFIRAGLAIANNTNGGKGTLAFNTNTVSLNAFPGSTALENFLAGKVSSGTIQTGTIPRNFTNSAYAFFAQDDWRIFPRITLNLGLRYENTLPIHEVNNLIGNIALGTPSGICQAGSSGCTLYRMVPSAIAPRFGLAWDVTGKGKTVMRTGFNIIYEQPWVEHFVSTQTTLQTVPTGLTLVNGGTVVTTPGGTINLASFSINPPASPIPWALNNPIFANYVSASGSCTNLVPCSVGGVTARLQYPMVLNWNFGIQHAITNSLTLDVSYVGDHGQHLNGFNDINKPIPGAGSTANEQVRRPYLAPYPWLATMLVFGADTNLSNYNALQVIARERASHGLTFLATYTYAHALASANATQINNPNSEYGNAQSDIRHRFTFGPSYLIPGKKGFGQMLEGWQLTSTLSIYSGRAFNPQDASDDLSGTGQGSPPPGLPALDVDRWTLVGNPGDFHGFGTSGTIPCFVSPSASGAFAAKVKGQNICTVGLPQACINAANGEPNGPAGVANNTGIAELNRLGCYMMGNSVMVPPAQGTFGSMSL
jgi:Carboxypeptidase regulatory-like domain